MRKGRLGIALIIAGLVLFVGRVAWFRTRTCVPVRMPISLSVGHIRTSEFKLNLRKLYLIEIEVQKRLPFDTLDCILGIGDAISGKCDNIPSVVNASWSLSTAGVTIGSGSSTEGRGGAWTDNTAARLLGSFIAEPGRLYTLEVDVLANGSFLNQTNPQLKVEVDPRYYEESALWDIPVFLASAVLVVVGVRILWKGNRQRPVVPKFLRSVS